MWRLEVADLLQTGVRRGRHDAAFKDATLADFALLPISVDPETERHAWSAIFRLAHELAQRPGLPLATLDDELRSAAESEGLIVIG